MSFNDALKLPGDGSSALYPYVCVPASVRNSPLPAAVVSARYFTRVCCSRSPRR